MDQPKGFRTVVFLRGLYSIIYDYRGFPPSGQKIYSCFQSKLSKRDLGNVFKESQQLTKDYTAENSTTGVEAFLLLNNFGCSCSYCLGERV